MKRFKHQDVMTVRAVFSDTMFVIPSFQRPYEWKPEMCEKLFDDILDAFESRGRHDDEHYFVGSLVMYEYGKKGTDDDDIQKCVGNPQRMKLEKSLKERERGLLKVVDGQQRLTSLLILLIALRDCELMSGGKAGDESLRSNLDELITACKGCRGSGKFPEFVRIRTNVLEDELVECDLQKMYDAQGNVPDNRSKRYNNYHCFSELIKNQWGNPTAKGKDASANCKKRREFTMFVLDHVQLLQLVCDNRDDAFKLFEVVNSRGLELSPASIMKPRVVAAHSRHDMKVVLQMWEKMSDEKEKNFLLNLFLYLRAIREAEKNRVDDSKQSIADYFTDACKDGRSLEENFVALRKMYAIHCFSGDPKFVVLQAILNKFPLNLHRAAYYKFMLDLFERASLFKESEDPSRKFEFEIDGSAEFENVLRPAYEFSEQIIRYYLGNMLTGSYSRDEVRGKFKNLVVGIAKGDASKTTFLSEIPAGLENALEDLKSRDCYDKMQGSLSFVLVWLCTYLKYRQDAERMSSYSSLFVEYGKRIMPDREHIHPKDWSENDGWTQKIHDEKTNLIGNLIPLELEINRTAGKESVMKKITGLGRKTLKKSSAKQELTYENSKSPEAREIAERYNKKEFPNGWLPEHVDAATAEKIKLLKDFFGFK